jgi:hypothetical protein
VLLGMMTRYTAADVIVVGLIGERGREVKEFVENILGPEGLNRAVVVATPADRPPLMRLHGAWLATAIAEYFRDQGRNVLLLMDSLTRFAQAQREIGLRSASRRRPRAIRPRCSRGCRSWSSAPATAGGGGSITAFYTVLTEGDDQQIRSPTRARDPRRPHRAVAAHRRGGHYPAIDIEASVSRVMHEIVTPTGARRSPGARLMSAYSSHKDLISRSAPTSAAAIRASTRAASPPSSRAGTARRCASRKGASNVIRMNGPCGPMPEAARGLPGRTNDEHQRCAGQHRGVRVRERRGNVWQCVRVFRPPGQRLLVAALGTAGVPAGMLAGQPGGAGAMRDGTAIGPRRCHCPRRPWLTEMAAPEALRAQASTVPRRTRGFRFRGFRGCRACPGRAATESAPVSVEETGTDRRQPRTRPWEAGAVLNDAVRGCLP